jgi:hypothetical protein
VRLWLALPGPREKRPSFFLPLTTLDVGMLMVRCRITRQGGERSPNPA